MLGGISEQLCRLPFLCEIILKYDLSRYAANVLVFPYGDWYR